MTPPPPPHVNSGAEGPSYLAALETKQHVRCVQLALICARTWHSVAYA
jgi:hypothetical protein